MTAIVELVIGTAGLVGQKFLLAPESDKYNLGATEYTATETAIDGIYTIEVSVADGNYRIVSKSGQWPPAYGALKIAGTSGKVYESFEAIEAAAGMDAIPKYGDDQIWDNGTDTIAVTVTEA